MKLKTLHHKAGNIMKTNILMLLLFCMFANIIYAQNQNCGQPLNCDPLTRYPYINCNKQVVCTNNPLSLIPHVALVEVPLCVTNVIDENSPSEINLSTGSGMVQVFNMADVPNDIHCAEDEWSCVCGMQGQNCRSTVFLYWSSDPLDFDNDEEHTLGQSTTIWIPDDNCELIVNEDNWIEQMTSRILLNNCTDFLCQGSNNEPTRTYINTDATIPSNTYCQTYNLCDVIGHEIGHLYGLYHFDEINCNPTPLSTSSTMYSSLQSNQSKKGLSKDDKCAFARLYCNPVYVEDGDSLLTQVLIKTYPTPTQSILNIEFTLNGVAVDLIFQVYNETGKLVYENGYFYTNKGLNRITEDFSFLPNGTYYFKIYSEINVFSGKFVIAK